VVHCPTPPDDGIFLEDGRLAAVALIGTGAAARLYPKNLLARADGTDLGEPLLADLVAIKASVDALAPYLDGLEALLGPLATAAGQATLLAAVQASTPADNFKAITPNDSTALTTVPKALFIGVAGNLTVKGGDGQSALFPVQAGQILPIRARYVMATGTTATGIVAIS